MYNAEFVNALKEALNGLRTIHAVGEEWCSYIGKIPAGGVPYCGQEVARSTYSALWQYIQSQGLVKSESEWQSIYAAQGGNVPFYSDGNGSSTFRVPRLVGYVRGASDQSEAGAYIKEGLPNITGSARGGLTAASGTIGGTGAFADNSTGSATADYASGTRPYITLKFDASKSNAIYGNSDHVTPETSVVLFGVYAFGEVVNVGELDAATLAQELDNKLSKSGGMMTGGITFPCGGGIEVNAKYPDELSLRAENTQDVYNGAYLSLRTSSCTKHDAGSFQLGARVLEDVEENQGILRGFVNGSLTWNTKNIVRSVNGAEADASGNVTLALGGTVSQKHNSTVSGIGSSSNKTVSITGLTANKPVYLAIKCSSGTGSYDAVITSGTAINFSDSSTYSSSFGIYVSEVGETSWGVAIPSGTSLTLKLRGANTNTGNIQVIAWQ